METQNPSTPNIKAPSQEPVNGINIPALCNTLLRIVARLNENEYTDSSSLLRQTEVMEHSNLADPASDANTSQG